MLREEQAIIMYIRMYMQRRNMQSIFDEEGWVGIDLKDGSCIYKRYNPNKEQYQYYFRSADGTTRRITSEEVYDIFYEEWVDWFVEKGIVKLWQRC